MPKIKTWMLKLDGEPSTFMIWRELFYHMKDPCLKTETTLDRVDYFLAWSRFDAIAERNDVIDLADQLLATLNGSVAIINDISLLKASRIRAIYDDGTHKEMSPNRIVRMTVNAGFPLNMDGTPPESASNSQHIAEAIIKKRRLRVLEVLRHYSIGNSWYELWKAFEIIEHDVGCETATGRKMIVSNKWMTKRELDTFCLSANYHRHTRYSKRTHGIQPESLIWLDEARRLVRRLIFKWMEHRKIFRIVVRDGKYRKLTYLVFGRTGYLLTHELDEVVFATAPVSP